jgi:hypothetical protein
MAKVERRTPKLKFRVLLGGDAKVRKEKHMASGSCTRPYTVINVPKLHIR